MSNFVIYLISATVIGFILRYVVKSKRTMSAVDTARTALPVELLVQGPPVRMESAIVSTMEVEKSDHEWSPVSTASERFVVRARRIVEAGLDRNIEVGDDGRKHRRDDGQVQRADKHRQADQGQDQGGASLSAPHGSQDGGRSIPPYGA